MLQILVFLAFVTLIGCDGEKRANSKNFSVFEGKARVHTLEALGWKLICVSILFLVYGYAHTETFSLSDLCIN